MLGFLPLVIDIGKINTNKDNERSESEVRFLTRLNNIYTGSTTSTRSSMKEYCLLFGQEFKVPNAKLGWLPKILYRCADQLAAMLTYSSCVMVIRFDLRMNGYSENNKAMTTFWRRFGKKLKRKYAALKIGHLWVREQSKAKQQHYHVIVIVDKNIIHYSGTVTDAVIEVWNGMTGGQAHIPKNCYYVIKPNNWPLFEKVFKRVSYLAKVNTKGYRPAQTKDFGSSRLKKRLIKT